MKSLANDCLELHFAPEARLVDRRRGVAWRLDASRRAFSRGDSKTREPLPAGTVEPLPGAFRVTHLLPDGPVRYLWTLTADHVRVELESAPESVTQVSLPGAFRPEAGGCDLLLPPYQGLLYRAGHDEWEETKPGGAHGNFSLCTAALLAECGGLLVTQETPADWVCRFGDAPGGAYLDFEQQRCPVRGWYGREARLYPVDADITAAAKRYRARLKERGEFVSWEEKIARKPVLENLFGALMAFTGYNHAPELDYAGNARALREMGFESVLYYPVRMCHYTRDFLMGGDAPVWLSDEEIARVKAVPGALVSPWGWFIEGLDDGSERMRKLFRRRQNGDRVPGWRIEHQQWYETCPPYQIEEIRRRFATDMAAMDWIHYDVNATRLGRSVCYAKDHDLHGHRPLCKTDDVEWTRRLLGPETNGNRIVSSEGFVDRYAVSYDIGTTKLWPAAGPGARFIPVPLTMLVLHDSTVHDWWEVDNYNELPGYRAEHRFGRVGSGGAQRKAALDALYGSPPNVFPFGRQYGWTDLGSRRTFSYTIHLDDRAVQRALALALPVTRLHRRIGKLELRSFEFLSDDHALQATTFADGTRIVANLGDRSREHPSAGVVPPYTWKEIRT